MSLARSNKHQIHANKIWEGSSLCSFLQPFSLLSQAVPNISCSNLKLCSSLRMTDAFPHFQSLI